MTEYALFKSGIFERTKRIVGAPPVFSGHPSKASWRWHPVVREQGSPAGWSVEGETAYFRTEPPKILPRRSGTFVEFLELFTPTEQLTIKTASMADAALGLWFDKATSANSIDLEDAATVQGLTALVAAGLLTTERHAEILASDFDGA